MQCALHFTVPHFQKYKKIDCLIAIFINSLTINQFWNASRHKNSEPICIRHFLLLLGGIKASYFRGFCTKFVECT